MLVILGVLLALGYSRRNPEKRALDELGRSEARGGRFARLSDGLTFYRLSGPDSGTPVVLVHGFSTPSYIWDSTAIALTGNELANTVYGKYGHNVLYGGGGNDALYGYDGNDTVRGVTALGAVTVDNVGDKVDGDNEFQLEDDVWNAAFDADIDGALDRDGPQRRIAAWLAERGIPCLDLLPNLRAEPREDDGRYHLYHLKDTHFIARGNAVVGRALAAFVRDELGGGPPVATGGGH